MNVTIERTVLQSGKQAFKVEWEQRGAVAPVIPNGPRGDIGGVYSARTRGGAEAIKTTLLDWGKGRIDAATRDAMIAVILKDEQS
jgi:hypothetical protein